MLSTRLRVFFKRRSKVAMRNPSQPQRRHLDMDYLEERSLLSKTLFDVTNLISDQAGVAAMQDTDLVNPWGIAMAPTGPFWIADNHTDRATIYFGDVNGSALVKSSLVVTIPGGSPTGQVFNGSGDFVVQADDGSSGPAVFLFASEAGLITGWNPNVPPPPPSTEAQIGATVADTVYKGLTIATNGSANLIYAANFSQHRIDVFDTNFNP